jgi:hypothetical protein
MRPLNPEGQQYIQAIAAQYNLSQDAVLSMLQAVVNGGGKMAQFNIYELGGNGQWMQGGMTMVGDMFNYGLKSKVNGLCQDLSNLIANAHIFVDLPLNVGVHHSFSSHWYPAELGSPASSGSQNNIRYAFFPAPVSRLAIEINGEVSIYDTLNHHISGVSQQQGNGFSVLFTSQMGYVDILNLPLIAGKGTVKNTPIIENTISEIEEMKQEVAKEPTNLTEDIVAQPVPVVADENDIFNKIERLAELFKKEILTETEFKTKKAELLARL